MFNLFTPKPRLPSIEVTQELFDKALDRAVLSKVNDYRGSKYEHCTIDEKISESIVSEVNYRLNQIVRERIDLKISEIIDRLANERADSILEQFEKGEFSKQVMNEAVARLLQPRS